MVALAAMFPIWGTKSSLEEDVHSEGIPAIDNDDVRAHVRKTTEARRSTALLWALGIFGYIARAIMLIPLYKLLLPYWSRIAHRGFAILASLILAKICWDYKLGAVEYLMLAPLVLWIGGAILHQVAVSYEEEFWHYWEAIVYRWETHTVDSFDDVLGGNAIDVNIRDRLQMAKKIPGVRVRILADINADPFPLAIRGHFWWKQKVAIGAWNTGTYMDHI